MSLRVAIFAFGLIPCHVMADTLTAARVIRANTIIEPSDIAVTDLAVPGALTADTDIAGMETRITLYPGRPIMQSHIGPAALIKRNQPVTLIYRHGGLSIATEARALSRGGAGDTVRVMNLASRSTVVGRVTGDGTVEVSSERDVN